MPLYLGSGSHEFKNQKYRFVVMEKFGTDLWKIFLENNRTFPSDTVFKLGIQIVSAILSVCFVVQEITLDISILVLRDKINIQYLVSIYLLTLKTGY